MRTVFSRAQDDDRMGRKQVDAVGVDWSSGVWLAVAYDGGEYEEVATYDHIEAVWERYRGASSILVDVPIGLVSRDHKPDQDKELSRECDSLARAAVGQRHSSVFTPPAREAAEEVADGATYEEVMETNRDITGKGLTQQAKAISEGIAQVDRFLRNTDGEVRMTLEEAHPEVCFRAFAGEELQYSKKTAQGFGERIEALASYSDQPESTVRKVTAELCQKESDADIDVDDVIDAIALAIAASGDDDELHSLPEKPPRDAADLRMQIVYRSEEPLSLTK